MTATERPKLLARLCTRVDAAGISVFRAAFGALMVAAVARFVARGWVYELYQAPTYHFTYLGFDWVKPWPGGWMYVHFALMGLSALGIALGAFTRVSAALFFLTFTYAELIDKATYLNHYYLVSLLALLLCFVPSNRRYSVDAWRLRRRGKAMPGDVGLWAYWLLRAQVGLVYGFAGLAKLNPDWLLRAEPLRTWLPGHADVPWLGSLLAEPGLAYVMSWAGAAFDLSVVPLLCLPQTRRYAYAAAALFHTAVWSLFPIGVFSWVMLVAGSVFFDPAWPRRGVAPPVRQAHANGSRLVVVAAIALVGVYLALQLAVPLRFLAYSGSPNWTEEAFRFAWRVMLIEKTGNVEYRVVSARGERRERPRDHLTPLQAKMLSTQPDMIQQFAQELARREAARSGQLPRVYADAWAALNGRPAQRLVDPDVDLARAPRTLRPKPWIVPLGR
jgi:vitamin K-dependent gamma-carboxylase